MKIIKVQDDRQRRHIFTAPPRRVVSLVPSDTYSVIRLGAKDRLVGRTRFCIAPEGEVEAIEDVGGTKDVDVDKVLALEPDLVIANQEENTRSQIERLDAAGVAVFVSFPKRVADGIAHLARLALALGLDRDDAARSLLASAYHAHREAEKHRGERVPVRAFVPIWMDPLMTVHEETFISDMMDLVGAQNIFADRRRRYPLAADLGKATPLPPERVGNRDTRYPRVTLDEVVARQPEIVLLPDEPHAFTEDDAEVFRKLDIPAAKTGRVLLCNGKDLMWYGARSVEGFERLRRLVNGGELE
ncbi:ABC transporter substrate-binding protein [Polyangium jinanense]|uniref:ABC transporter substrate-binding protein n=1 Tax=Polyangium jinanense TaxID=2829994 RepID=A0A9X3WXW3_9BACT|nr:helical backbone metal receptor [Polyangium jinanense]MDC3952546.1 ABC transporter substrate-binding protein [Polyangium jinanense]MDC3980174.1 ABC transporter substrate-binding protein [Polyangium jinanense]